MNYLVKFIEHNYNRKEIVHIYSIILRANYEMTEHNIPFELKQVDNFNIKYNNVFEFNLNNNIFKLKINEMKELINYIYCYYEKEYPIDYDYKLIDPIYFSLFFYDLLDKIIKVKEDIINIKDVQLLRYKSNPVKMKDSERYKALLNSNYKMYSPFKSNSVNETPEERLQNILKSIKEKGYSYGNQVPIFYNDEPYIRDGQHRISVIKYLYGDIDIKIIRFYLKDNYFYE